jgi:hypothetical protein
MRTSMAYGIERAPFVWISIVNMCLTCASTGV